MNPITVILVDDHDVVRTGLRSFLETQPGMQVVAEARDGEAAIRLAVEKRPNIILMDITMPGMDGLEATRRIRKKVPTAKVLFLTQYESKQHILSAIKAGAAGYIPKKALSSELLAAIRTVYMGDPYLGPSATKALIEGYQQRVEGEPYDRLTAREREIVKLVATGHTSREIGNMLHISLKTVQGHRMKITKKLGLGNRTELIKYMMRKGLVDINT